ncbi:MAG: hypothetical protein Tsb0026_01410 [Sulfuricaulis sp.]
MFYKGKAHIHLREKRKCVGLPLDSVHRLVQQGPVSLDTLIIPAQQTEDREQPVTAG